jgi:hypothetical protein
MAKKVAKEDEVIDEDFEGDDTQEKEIHEQEGLVGDKIRGLTSNLVIADEVMSFSEPEILPVRPSLPQYTMKTSGDGNSFFSTGQ